MTAAVIAAMHSVLPSKVLTAAEVDAWLGEQAGWTANKTGVLTRHIAADDDTVAQLGARAVRELIEQSDLQLSDVDAIVAASATREQFLPSTAAFIAEHLGAEARGIPAFDIDASCLSWVMGLDLMSRAMTTGMYRRIVLVSAEVPSRGLVADEKEAAAIFGDAAVAAIIETESQVANPTVRQIGRSRFETYAEAAHYAEVRAGSTHSPQRPGYLFDADDFRFLMNGPELYRLVAREFPGFIERFLDDSGVTLDDFDLIVPHQASKPAVELVARRLKVPEGRYAQDYRRFGNTVSASIPLSLHMARQEGRIAPGDRVLLTGTASGLTFGALEIEV